MGSNLIHCYLGMLHFLCGLSVLVLDLEHHELLLVVLQLLPEVVTLVDVRVEQHLLLRQLLAYIACNDDTSDLAVVLIIYC